MIIILIASILQTSTGFGFSIMATPFLLLLFAPREAIQINLALSLVISSVLIMKIRHDVDTGILKRFIIGSSAGLLIGILIFVLADLTKLKLGISIVILVLTILLIFQFRTHQSLRRDFIVGGISGAMTTSIGMPGPPLLLYFSGTGTKKEKLRATTLAFYLFIYFVSLLMQVIIAGTSIEAWKAGGLAVPVVLAGLVLGQLLFRWINQRLFRLFMYMILLFTGIYLLFESLYL
ncbi:sulfite exporter TauE/SafE family protein [Thalassobacillus devorans]|uniref:sulfite exporter TauE/SafE family protein n=1 Tax=Thalassobacillus devorans TaxID=279813 RepID=UPI00055EA206|nr:sulfite exporter TauE/SafE family protein [Thalassobacillus devorans]